MECFSHGLMYKEIEDKLGLGSSALKRLQHGLFGKLGAHKAAEAVSKWQRLKAGPML